MDAVESINPPCNDSSWPSPASCSRSPRTKLDPHPKLPGIITLHGHRDVRHQAGCSGTFISPRCHTLISDKAGHAHAILSKSASRVTRGRPCSIAVAAMRASVSFTDRRTPAARQSATSRANEIITASLTGIGSAVRASAWVSARRDRVAESPALSTPSCSSPIVITESATRSGRSAIARPLSRAMKTDVSSRPTPTWPSVTGRRGYDRPSR